LKQKNVVQECLESLNLLINLTTLTNFFLFKEEGQLVTNLDQIFSVLTLKTEVFPLINQGMSIYLAFSVLTAIGSSNVAKEIEKIKLFFQLGMKIQQFRLEEHLFKIVERLVFDFSENFRLIDTTKTIEQTNNHLSNLMKDYCQKNLYQLPQGLGLAGSGFKSATTLLGLATFINEDILPNLNSSISILKRKAESFLIITIIHELCSHL